MTTPSEQHHASPPPEENGGEEPGGEQLASSDEAAMEGEEIDEQLISEKLQRQVEFAQKLFDDRTLVPMPRPKMPEPRHRAFHIFWGIVLLLVVVFVRRLPRYPATQMPERVLEGDGLRYWETMQLLGSDIKAGLLRRLQGDPESARHFLEFSQLAKESADRRDKHEQRMYAFQKQLIQAFNPLLILRDRMGSTLDQLPPRKDKQPVNADELRAHLQALSAAAEEAFEVKNSFLREKILRKATDELHADPAVCRQLRRVMELEAAGMPRAAALLDFHVSNTTGCFCCLWSNCHKSPAPLPEKEKRKTNPREAKATGETGKGGGALNLESS
ncbi:hypothetical protein Efla_006847 [Eimeria flavescens]